MLDPHFNSMSLKGKIPHKLAFSVGVEISDWKYASCHLLLPTYQFHSKHYFPSHFTVQSPKYTRLLFLFLMNLQNPAQSSAS